MTEYLSHHLNLQQHNNEECVKLKVYEITRVQHARFSELLSLVYSEI